MTLSSLPVMDKQLMMEYFDELVTVPDLKQMELRQFDEHKSTEQKTFKYKYHMVHSFRSTGLRDILSIMRRHGLRCCRESSGRRCGISSGYMMEGRMKSLIHNCLSSKKHVNEI